MFFYVDCEHVFLILAIINSNTWAFLGDGGEGGGGGYESWISQSNLKKSHAVHMRALNATGHC